MPLHILLALVVGGIAAIAVLLHLLGLSARRKLTENTAKEQWLRHFPDDPARTARLSPDRFAALLWTDKGPGLIWSFGADTVARHLEGAKVVQTKDALRFRFVDYGAPSVTIKMPTSEAENWQQELSKS